MGSFERRDGIWNPFLKVILRVNLFLAFDFCRFCVVIVFSSLPQRLMNSDFEGFLSQILSITFIIFLS